MGLTDTVSSSWQDTGIDALSDTDSVTGQSDSFTWNQFNSLTDDVSEFNGAASFGAGMQSFSMADTGSETLAADESDSGSLTVATASDQFDIQEAFGADSARSESWNVSTTAYSHQGSGTVSEADGYTFDDVGNDSLSGTSSFESDSYEVSDWEYDSLSFTDSGDLSDGTWGTGTEVTGAEYLVSYSLTVGGTDSISDGHDVATISHDGGTSDSGGGTISYSVPLAYGEISVCCPYGLYPYYSFYEFEGTGGADASFSSEYWLADLDGYEGPYGPFSWTSTDGGLGEVFVTAPLLPAFGVPGWENASEGSPLSVIEEDQLNLGQVTLDAESGTLYLSGPRVKDDFTAGGGTSSSSGGPNSYRVPDSAPVFLAGSALDLGVATPGFLPYGTTFGVAPSTNAATPSGLPDQEATAVSNMAQDRGKPDGVSRDATPSPTDTLIALAAAGRNPTDITLPTQGTAPTIPIPTPMATPGASTTSSASSSSGTGGANGDADARSSAARRRADRHRVLSTKR